jgi:hypothetical protein
MSSSSDDEYIDSICVHTCACFELRRKLHFARAAEKAARAVAAARARQAEDCLIVAYLELNEAQQILANLSTQQPVEFVDAFSTVAVKLLPSAARVLQRRLAAGTLLPGACRPIEEAWFSVYRERRDAACGRAKESPREQRLFAPFVGYLTYMAAGALATDLLSTVSGSALPVDHMRMLYALVTSAVDLVAQPRPASPPLQQVVSLRLQGEQSFVTGLRQLFVRAPAGPAVPHSHGAPSFPFEVEARQLAAAWQRVLAADVLQPRGLDERTEERSDRERDESLAAAKAALAREPRRACGLPSCGRQEAHASQFKLCAACNGAVYCSKEHQAEHWAEHKAECKAARKAAAVAAPAAAAQDAAGPSGA